MLKDLIKFINALQKISSGLQKIFSSIDKPRKISKSVDINYHDNNDNLGRLNVPTVAEILKDVETLEDIENLDKKAMNYTSDLEYDRYTEAFDKAGDRIFYYQYLPFLDLGSTSSELENTHMVVPAKDYKRTKKRFQPTDAYWFEISAADILMSSLEDVIQEKPDYLPSLIEFNRIVTRDISLAEKIELLYPVCSNDLNFSFEFITKYTDSEEQIKRKILIRVLELYYDIPLIRKLYEEGYKTLDDFRNMNLEEVAKIKGFGKIRIEKLRKAIKAINKHESKY